MNTFDKGRNGLHAQEQTMRLSACVSTKMQRRQEASVLQKATS